MDSPGSQQRRAGRQTDAVKRRSFHPEPNLLVIAVAIATAANLPGQRAAEAEAEAKEEAEARGQAVDSVPGLFGSALSTIAPDTIFSRNAEFFEKLWSLPVLIDNPEARIIQEFRITGLYQVQYGAVSAREGSWDGGELRRARLGLRMRFLDDFVGRLSFKRNGETANFDRQNLEDGWISWRRNDRFGVKLGQQKPLWSEEWSTSSSVMLTVERSLLINQLAPPHSIGVYLSGEEERRAWGLGGFGGTATSTSFDDDGFFLLANYGIDSGDGLGFLTEARWRVDYLYNGGSPQLAGTGYRHAVSTSVTGIRDPFDVTGHVLYSRGQGDSGDTFGLILQPSVTLIENRLDFVARYQFAHGSGDSLVLQSRYEQKVDGLEDGVGETYHAWYAGLNYYLYGNRLKLITGVEYSRMNDKAGDGGDFNGWTFFGGLRLFF